MLYGVNLCDERHRLLAARTLRRRLITLRVVGIAAKLRAASVVLVVRRVVADGVSLLAVFQTSKGDTEFGELVHVWLTDQRSMAGTAPTGFQLPKRSTRGRSIAAFGYVAAL